MSDGVEVAAQAPIVDCFILIYHLLERRRLLHIATDRETSHACDSDIAVGSITNKSLLYM